MHFKVGLANICYRKISFHLYFPHLKKNNKNIFVQTSASECVLVTMLAARAQAIKQLKQQHPFVEEGHLLSKLMAYCSKEAHSCVEKAAMICFVKLRILEPDTKCSLRGDTLTKVYDCIQFSVNI